MPQGKCIVIHASDDDFFAAYQSGYIRFVTGYQGTTLTDVNLRSDASLSGTIVGMAERGSRVRILSTKNNACEVVVLQHSRTKSDPDSLDRGWINRKYLDSVQ